MHKKIIALILILSLLLCGCNEDKNVKDSTENYEEQLKEAKTTPYGKYPEEITYTLGKLTAMDNSNLPEGESYEDNAYTRYLKEHLNIQNIDTFEAFDSEYDSFATMAITSNDMPDVMIVSNLEDLKYLVENDKIEDMTDAYNNCMTDKIKDIYASYGSDILDTVTFDGKIMAIPETNIDDGANLIWLRKDWIDELGLEEPKTLADVENIIQAFTKRNDETVGLVCRSDMGGEAGYSYEYQMDIIFANYNAYPKQWILNSSGEVVYGSIQNEAKTALSHIHDLYEKKTIDNDFLLRTASNIIDLIEDGKCGSFFGPWWAPNNPLMLAVEKDKTMNWQPYLISTKDDGSTSYHTHNPTSKYVVVKKGFEYPELVCKELSMMFDYLRYEEDDVEEFDTYYQTNVDPTARPIAINIDYIDALTKCYKSISDALGNNSNIDNLGILENAYYSSCKSYLDSPESATIEEWAAYTSRITAASLIQNGKLTKVESLYFGETTTMVTSWWKLKELEKQAYLKIITGEEDLDYFDEFVKEWYAQGGSEIEKEVREELAK